MSVLTPILIVVVLAGIFFALWIGTFLFAQKTAMVAKPAAPGTPSDAGLPYEELTIQSGSRRLQAWWIGAAPANDARKALLIYHGNSETIPEWIPALQELWRNGISSFIFDYSGFGNSTGHATFRTLHEDAIAARKLFDQKAGGLDKYVLGLSLGSGVMLEGQAGLTAGACGVILVAAFSSSRDIARAWKLVIAPLAFLAPRIYDNTDHIGFVSAPVLIVHSRNDELFPPWMAEKLYAHANEPKRITLLDGLKHNGMLEGRHVEYLAPIISFMKTG